MAGHDLDVIMKEKGATTQFFLTSYGNKPETRKSRVYQIDNKVKVSFRVKADFLYIALQNTQDTPYKISIICKDLNYSKEHVCPNLWSSWIQIGALDHKHVNHLGCFKAEAEVYASVYKYTEKTPGLVQFFGDSDLTDFRLGSEESHVAVHRAYLAAHSDFFKGLLTNTWKESNEGIVEMKGHTLQTLNHLKEFLYLGNLPEYNDLLPLLTLASEYCLTNLKEECITKLAQTVVPENVFSLLDFACDFKLPELSFAVTTNTPADVIHKSYNLKRKLADTEKAEEEASDKKECEAEEYLDY